MHIHTHIYTIHIDASWGPKIVDYYATCKKRNHETAVNVFEVVKPTGNLCWKIRDSYWK